MVFGTVEELSLLLGQDIPADPDDTKNKRATLLLKHATSRVKNYCRQQLEFIESDEIMLHPQGEPHEVWLPERPVVDVTSLTVAGFTVADFEFVRFGRVRWAGDFISGLSYVVNAPFIDEDWPPEIQVVYDHGFQVGVDDEELDEITTVALGAAARAWTNPESIDRDEVGQDVVVYGDARGVSLTEDDKAILRRYRQTIAS